MVKAILVVGLPGSGKTTYANHVPHSKIFDDPGRTTADIKALKTTLQTSQDATIVVTDIYSCKTSTRESIVQALKKWGADEVDVVYFENDPVQCLKNLKYRNDGRLISEQFVKQLSDQYQIPHDATVLPVWKGIE